MSFVVGFWWRKVNGAPAMEQMSWTWINLMWTWLVENKVRKTSLHRREVVRISKSLPVFESPKFLYFKSFFLNGVHTHVCTHFYRQGEENFYHWHTMNVRMALLNSRHLWSACCSKSASMKFAGAVCSQGAIGQAVCQCDPVALVGCLGWYWTLWSHSMHKCPRLHAAIFNTCSRVLLS